MTFIRLLSTVFFNVEPGGAIIWRVLFIAGVWKMFQKSGIKKWWAVIPIAREYMLARCAGREPEGRVYAVIEALALVTGIFSAITENNGLDMYLAIVILALFIASLIYEIRICSGLIEVYGVKRRWIIPWLIGLEFIPALVWGFSEKYQPRRKADDIINDSLLIFSGSHAEEKEDGLTVNLQERTTIEFFRKKYLLRDIHIRIEPGSLVLLLGGSGAGKTTFLNAVNGYEKAKAKVVLNNRDVYAEYKKMQYEVGFVPQQDLIRDKDTVYRTMYDTSLLRLPINLPHSKRIERINEVLDLFGLGSVKNNLVEKLSGGQRKRLSIAMEYLSNPALFILDEPDSGLDGVIARKLMEHLRTIADQGKIVIVITHTPDRVIDLFDDVIVLAKDSNRTGRVAFFGSIEEARSFFGRDKMEEIVMCINQKDEGGEGRADEFITKYMEVQHA